MWKSTQPHVNIITLTICAWNEYIISLGQHATLINSKMHAGDSIDVASFWYFNNSKEEEFNLKLDPCFCEVQVACRSRQNFYLKVRFDVV